MCLFIYKGFVDIKFNIIENGVSEEFQRGANSQTHCLDQITMRN